MLKLLFIRFAICAINLLILQIARSLHIIFQVLLTYLLLGTTTSFVVLQACAVICAGYVLGSWGEVNFSWTGLLFGMGASFFTALNALYVKKTLAVVNDDQWLLLIYNTVNSILVLAPFVLLSGELTAINKLPFLGEPQFWIGMVVSAVLGFLINIASFLQIKFTSPLTHMISGTAKVRTPGNTVSYQIIGSRANSAEYYNIW